MRTGFVARSQTKKKNSYRFTNFLFCHLYNSFPEIIVDGFCGVCRIRFYVVHFFQISENIGRYISSDGEKRQFRCEAIEWNRIDSVTNRNGIGCCLVFLQQLMYVMNETNSLVAPINVSNVFITVKY